MADTLPSRGSLLLDSLGRAFGDILRKDFQREIESEKKKDRESEIKKPKKGEKKEEKTPAKKEVEQKRVVREGYNSLITHPNASCYSVFSHVRHIVLQNQLCETYNARLGTGDEEEVAEKGETSKKELNKLPVIVELGVKGVFAIIRDVWHTNSELCVRALREFLHILEGQEPFSLKNEPKETTAALFDLLMEMVRTSRGNKLHSDLDSVASACLLSLVIAVGDTGKMLQALTTMLTQDQEMVLMPIPEIFNMLQASVQAVLLGGTVADMDWSNRGILTKSCVEQWPLKGWEGKKGEVSRMASDGLHLYLHGAHGLVKLGSGYGNTKKGHVYKLNSQFYPHQTGWLGFISGKLLFFPLGRGDDTLTVIDVDTLEPRDILQLSDDSIGRHCLFTNGTSYLQQIRANKEGGFVLRTLDVTSSLLPCTDERKLHLSQKSVLRLGHAKFDTESTMHTVYQDSIEQVVRVLASKYFTAVQTASGKLLYTGSGSVFGLTGSDVPKGEWHTLELPDKGAKVGHCSCDSSGSFCLVVSDKGVVYFGGTNKKGESGEDPGRQQKALKLIKMIKLKDQEVAFSACGAHSSALVTSDGKLYLFGSFDEDLTDKGVVVDLLGIPVSQVAMGRTHTCVLTQDGRIFTFGGNQFGQCGRNFVAPKEEDAIVAAVVEEESSSEEEGDDSGMCPKGEHKWSHSVCMMCKFCGFCTGYGPNCCNEGLPGRDPGAECGCGNGDSGCSACGCCQVCGGEKESWGGLGDGFGFGGDLHLLRGVRGHPKDKKDKKKDKKKRVRKDKKEGEKKEDKEKGEMGLQLLFGNAPPDGPSEGGKEEGSKEEGAEKAEDLMSTKKPKVVELPEQDMTVMQVDCGLFHTAILLHSGDLYVFGSGNHGQLGQGNNLPSGKPVKVSLPAPAIQVACGDNHTAILLETGKVYTFGRYQEGQLGRQRGQDEGDNWHMLPGQVSLRESLKPVSIAARSNQTFINVDESLVTEGIISRCKAFANSHHLGIVVPSQGSAKSYLVVIDSKTLQMMKFDGEDQQDLQDCAICLDPEYNILWSYSASRNQVLCFNPVAMGIKDPTGTILSSTICLPRSKEATISRSHASLNLLSCLHTLATSEEATPQKLATSVIKKYPKDDYLCVSRFTSHGGGWGYSASSVEAVQFSPSEDILLGGFGLYGGRGNYSADVRVYDLGEAGGEEEAEPEGNLIASIVVADYTCDRQQTYRVFFDKPVLLTADHWYLAYAAIASPMGASSDAGSSGQAGVSGPEKVIFKFKASRKSNNGTDPFSGQIPELLYRLPEFDEEEKLPSTKMQLLSKEFSCSVSPGGVGAILELLNWSWSHLTRNAYDGAASELQHFAFIAKAALGLLKTYIQRAYPIKGLSSNASLDSTELSAVVNEAKCLLKLILSSHEPALSADGTSPVQSIVSICQEAFLACFDAFYPSLPLKWYALCEELQSVDPNDVFAGMPRENLLSALLEALSGPSVSYIGLGFDTDIALASVLHNSEVEGKFPILSEYMQMKTLEEAGGGVLLPFNMVASKLLAIVAVPILSSGGHSTHTPTSPVIDKAGQLLLSRINELALCAVYSETAALSGGSGEQKEKVWESPCRFATKLTGVPSVEVKEVAFSVNKAVRIHGYGVYCGADMSRKYKVTLQKGEEVLASNEGKFNNADCYGEEFINLSFKSPPKLEPDVVYTARVELTGSSFDIGTGGNTILSSPGGVDFTLHHTGVEISNPETGPISRFLYSLVSPVGVHNVIELSVHLATTMLGVTVGFLRRSLDWGSDQAALLEALGKSFLFSTLLPTTLAQLGPLASRQPKYAVQVLDLVRSTLPMVLEASRQLGQGSEEGKVYSDTKHRHYAVIETDHPYKQACVTHHKVTFSNKVQWMSIEFDPRTGFAQKEDKIAELLIQGCPKGTATPTFKALGAEGNENSNVASDGAVVVTFDDLYMDWERYSLEYPPGMVILPGNEVHISTHLDTEYEKKDSNNHFGFRLQVIGYEWSTEYSDCLKLLQKELVSLGAVCASTLLRDDVVLPYTEELSVGDPSGTTEKADMRIVQAAAQEVLAEYPQVLGRGLLVEAPKIADILSGNITMTTSNEQEFLKDFIECKSSTAGGRLARWLQPNRAVDPEASELQLPLTTPSVGLPAEFQVVMKDQKLKPIHVEGMKVEVKAVWLGRKGQDEECWQDKAVDEVLGVRKPTFSRSYAPTQGGSGYLYHSISMMMPYSDYSFEELRLFAPKLKGSVESFFIKDNKDGTYLATWVPSASGNYLLQVYIDGNAVGKEEKVEVIELEVPQGGSDSTKVERSGEELTVIKPKLKRVSGKIGGGVRIRVAPSCECEAIGIAKSGVAFSYVEELENDAGKWVKLSKDALNQFSCRGSEGYALAYNKEKKEAFLEDVEPTPDTAVQSVVQRKGGCGTYGLFQCGSAGHNIRSKPAMQGTPIGRLVKGNKIEAIEELENDCGTWLKLSKESAKKYCEGDCEAAWTLAVAPSGKAFLVMEGDADYEGLQAAEAQATSVSTSNFPTAAQVFGTIQKPSFLSTPVAPPPNFQFGSSSKQPKLLFGAGTGAEAVVPQVPPPSSFKFTAAKSPAKKEEKGKENSEAGEKTDDGEAVDKVNDKAEELSSDEKISFSIGSGGRAKVAARRRRGRSSCSPSRSSSPEGQKQGAEATKAEASESTPKEEAKAEPPAAPARQTLSPAMAECQRAVFAAFLWHEGLVHDAIASSSYLKFHPELTVEMRESIVKRAQPAVSPAGQKQPSDDGASRPEELTSVVASVESDLMAAKAPILPATLNHLVTFWEELSTKVLEASTAPFTPPKVPALAQELQKRYEEEKAALEKRKKEKESKAAVPAGGGGGGGGGATTMCELCDQTFPDPVTYHMKEVHPGCGKHASGWGYNSRGSFCSGWAGNCGDGGRGGSTWYLMCKDCHKKYTTMKQEKGRKSVKAAPMPKLKTKKPGKPRTLPITNVVQGMTQNAKFLLELGSAVESPTGGVGASGPPGTSRQSSVTSELGRQTSVVQPSAADRPPADGGNGKAPPRMYRRAISMAVSNEEDVGGSPAFVSQMSLDESSGPVEPDADMLITKPSLMLKRLMYNRSKHSQKKPETNYSSKVLPFVVRHHDLDGLRASMRHTMRQAGVKTFAMELLEWLLKEVRDPSTIHDLLWLFNCALVEHPMQQMAAVRANRKEDQKDQKDVKWDECTLSKHPLASLEGAGVMLDELRKQFHSFLQTVSNMMPTFPMGSAVQQVAMQCWCLTFQPQDHSFLIQSNVFANISKALSGVDGAEESEGTKIKNKEVEVFLMEDAVSKGQLKVSSNEAMANSLTDGSTETFWESRDEPRGKPRHIIVTFPNEQKLFAVAVHIDNQKDAAQQVDSLSLLVGQDEDSLKEVTKVKVSLMHVGWKCLRLPGDKSYTVVKVEVTGLQNSVRVRQLQVLVHPSNSLDCALSSVTAQQQACEAQALRVFRLLTSQVFGGLLVSKAPEKGGEEADAAAPPEDGEGESVEHMVDILDVKYKFSNLQKQVCIHVIESVHTEMERMKDEWEVSVAKAPPPKPAQGAAQEAPSGKEAKSSDSYCFELLSMVTRLSQSDSGCEFLSKQDKLVQDLFALLHIATVRIQLQVCALLYRVLPVVGPQRLREALRVPILPPIGYSAIAEAVNSAASINQLGILDCLLAVIGKALSVQVKAKGRFPNVLQSLVGDSGTTAVTLSSLLNPKPIMGEAAVKSQRWYMKGAMTQEVAFEVVKLIKDMTKGTLGNQWQGIVKAAIGQAVLHLTKVHESMRVPDPGMYSQTLWLSLAALCVIDEEHADALSSGQWLGKDGKPKAKPLCDNHDDGETQALILCDKCGNLCGECDRVLHYKRNTTDHQRQVFKEEEEAVKVDLHEGCGRIKLYWTMAVADYRTLKGMIEFRETAGSSKGTCRYCGTSNNTGLLPVGYVCSDQECQERVQNTCDRTLSCGHMCCGVKGEEKCLPCLHGCPSETGVKLKQDADDMCMICYTEGLSCAPVIQLGCGHMFHYHCCRKSLTKRWSGPRIAFRFMFCSICTNTPISHPNLADVLDPSRELYEDVKRKCLLRLEFENLTKCEALNSPTSKFYQKPLDYAMWKYAYYVCCKCKKAYYGGEAHCAEAIAGSDEYNADELVCPSCSNVGGAVQICPKHGTDFLEYKCRYCCSVAVYFCFGTTHFCGPCHDDFQRLTGMPVSELPQCPVGPRAKPLEGTECPLHVKHPPNGEEFALGCGVCRNAQTF